MGFKINLLVLFGIVIFFTIGLNVGMHGMVHLSDIENGVTHLWMKIPSTNIETIDSTTKPNQLIVKSVVDQVLNNNVVKPTESASGFPDSKHPASPIILGDNGLHHTTNNVDNNPNQLFTKPVQNVVASTNAPVKLIKPKHIMSVVEDHSNNPLLHKVIITAQNKITAKTNNKLSQYLSQGGKFPIILLTCNRVELLDATLDNLLKVNNVQKDNIAIVQDGGLEGIVSVSTKYGIKLLQNKLGLHLRGGSMNDGGSRIATHYKFALSKAFDELFPNAPGIIIVEDDLLFSPDFYDYFTATAPILEEDDTLLCISAWNDNGFVGHVRNPFALKRTEFFPGLGWFLTRRLYKGELEEKWPSAHWDHWLRSQDTHKGRDILYPEVKQYICWLYVSICQNVYLLCLYLVCMYICMYVCMYVYVVMCIYYV